MKRKLPECSVSYIFTFGSYRVPPLRLFFKEGIFWLWGFSVRTSHTRLVLILGRYENGCPPTFFSTEPGFFFFFMKKRGFINIVDRKRENLNVKYKMKRTMVFLGSSTLNFTKIYGVSFFTFRKVLCKIKIRGPLTVFIKRYLNQVSFNIGSCVPLYYGTHSPSFLLSLSGNFWNL